MDENLKRIKYSEDNLKTGVEVPDTFITVGATDTYKLLEALNIDWKNLNIPNLKKITRWNSAGIRPSADKTFEVYENDITEASNNSVNNSVDWLNGDYDYLSDGLDKNYLKNSSPSIYAYELLPEWYNTGTITSSEDIADILNYLTWRVVTLDHYTSNWDKRNTEKVEQATVFYYDALYKDTVNEVLSEQGIGLTPYPNSDESTLYYLLVNLSNFTVTLAPTISRDHTSILTGPNNLYNALNNKQIGLGDNLVPAIKSSSPATIVLANTSVPSNTISKTSSEYFGASGSSYNRRFTESINGSDKDYYLFNLNFDVIGTGNYELPSVWLNTKLVKNINETSSLDPKTNSVVLTYNQSADNIEGVAYGDTDLKNINITINKTNNRITNFQFGVNNLFKDVVETSWGNVGTGWQLHEAQIPYYIEGVSESYNKYELSYAITYGEEYGIHPYFFIGSNLGTVSLDSNNLFNGFSTSNYGRITFENGKYYYIPPTENNRTDEEIWIYCVFYYNDNEKSRQINPLYIKFKLTLKAEIKNYFIFNHQGTNTRTVYNLSDRGFRSTNFLVSSSWCIGNDNNTREYYSDECQYNCINASNISYCIRTVEYDSLNDTAELKNKISFDDFVTTYCGSEYSVNYIGLTTQDDFDRIIDPLGNGTVTHNGNTYPISKEEYLHLGEESDGSFYYSSDSYKNYGVNTDFIDWINDPDSTPLDTTHISEPSGVILSDNNHDYCAESDPTFKAEKNKNTLFDLNKSTAMYPTKNGLFVDNSNYVDADNDYYYLVFRLTSEAGTIGSISYSCALAYYILKIVRREREYNLAMNDVLDEEITYMIENNTYSFRLMPRIPIYLHRLFNTTSQSILNDINGKMFWRFAGTSNDNSSIRWDDSIVALKDRKTNADFMKIYNVGDEYYYKTYNISEAKRNINCSFTPENNIMITLDSNGASTSTATTPILYIDKLLRDVDTTSEDSAASYVKIDTNSVRISLLLNVGNSTNYKRLNNNLTFSFNIYKRSYDFKLMEFSDTYNAYKALTYTTNNPKELVVGETTGYNELNTLNINLPATVNALNLKFLWIASNEFGAGSYTDTELSDRVAILLDSQNTPKININNNLNINASVSILLSSNDINSNNWVISNKGDNANKFTIDRSLIYNVVYFIEASGGNQNSLVLVGLNSSGQNVQTLNFMIYGDDDGIYRDCELKTYIKVINS